MNQEKEQTRNNADQCRYAAIYCRSATTGGSVPTQLEACHGFAREHGYLVPDAHVCLDDGQSGATLERPGLQRLRELIRTHAIQAVIVPDLARLSRALPHLFQLIDECQRAGIAVHVVVSPGNIRLDGLRSFLHEAEAPADQRR
jgi:site-specific DNA recombinase